MRVINIIGYRAKRWNLESLSFLRDLAIILCVAKLFGIVARKFRAPEVVGEILAGVLIGPAVVGILNNTIPALSVWRCDSSGVASVAGEYGKYSITVPQSIANYSLIYGQDSASQPLSTGDILPNDKKTLAISSNHMLQLEMTYGTETFSIYKDIPKVTVVRKLVIAQ